MEEEEKETIQIVFPESKREEAEEAERLFSSLRMRGISKSRIFNIEDILNWFKKLEVKEIELWIETSVKTGKIINLFVSSEGKGGVKVTLIPRKNN